MAESAYSTYAIAPSGETGIGAHRGRLALAVVVSVLLNASLLVLIETQWGSQPQFKPGTPMLIRLSPEPPVPANADKDSAADSATVDEPAAPEPAAPAPQQPAADTAEAPDDAPAPEPDARPLRQMLAEPHYLQSPGSVELPNMKSAGKEQTGLERRVFDPKLREKIYEARSRRSRRPPPDLNNSTMADAQELVSHDGKCFRYEQSPGGGPNEKVIYVKRCVGAETESDRIIKGLREALR